MRLFLFKIFIKIAAYIFPCRERAFFIADYGKQQVDIYNRQLEMNSTIRPKTYPKATGDVQGHYTDYFDRDN